MLPRGDHCLLCHQSHASGHESNETRSSSRKIDTRILGMRILRDFANWMPGSYRKKTKHPCGLPEPGVHRIYLPSSDAHATPKVPAYANRALPANPASPFQGFRPGGPRLGGLPKTLSTENEISRTCLHIQQPIVPASPSHLNVTLDNW
ncbi:hypothetical protein VDGE_30756 [Verticillium dahliae]|uniref:Uncharacterized protein n=2 Tax=Verticillium dahliae TaxID=27337 RepID=A0A444SA13_VERDA|nr:hypothetical protein VDGE_30756 [Verticillium dahliae]